VRLSRDIGAVTTDLDGIEDANVRVFGGVDVVTVGNLAGTALRRVDVDLNASTATGDGSPDAVTAVGTDGVDRVALSNADGRIVVGGLAVETRVIGGEETMDNLNVAALGGADTATMAVGTAGPLPVNVDGGAGADAVRYSGTPNPDEVIVVPNGSEVAIAAPATARLDTTAVESLVVLGFGGDDTLVGFNGLAALTALTLDGGGGADTLRGGDGADVLLGGGGNDVVDGNIGADRASLGSGNDHFQWDPGDGSDAVDGQGGADQLDFNGSNIGEMIGLSPNGRRVRLTRDIGAVTMDFDGIEQANLRVLAGTDLVTVGDLTGTALKAVGIDLSAFGGGGDGSPDTVTVEGTGGSDSVHVTRSPSEVAITGLAAVTRIVGSEPALDTLGVQTLGGNDDVTVAPDAGDLIAVLVDLGGGE
jgi:hypothetical protein